MHARKAIKRAILFNSPHTRYLVLSMFSNVYKNVTEGAAAEKDFESPAFRYELVAYPLPSTSEGANWRQLSQSLDSPVTISEAMQQPNEMIVCLEEVVLKLTTGVEKAYIAASTVEIEPAKMEEDYYSSKLILYDIKDAADKTFQLVYGEKYKMSITCLSCYRGQLATVMMDKRDRLLIFSEFDGEKRMIQRLQPDSNENLALCISFDADYVFMGDAYKNIKVLRKVDPEELKERERLDDPEKYIQVKKLYTNNISEKVIGVHSLRPEAGHKTDFTKLTEVEKQRLSILSVAESGYLRIYALREKKVLECIA